MAEPKPVVKCNFCGASSSEKDMLRSEQGFCICEDCVELAYNSLMESRAKKQENDKPVTYQSNLMTPSQIYDFLNEYVIGQDKAKQILSVAVYNHMKLLDHYDNIQDGDVEVEKSNIIMVGNSGSGKTFLIKNLARLFKVPYAIADATTLTESGYVGADVESVLQKLLNAADGDVKQAERGIVFIDEIDKKANKGGENNSITRDVSGEGVQQALLKLLEGAKVDVQLTGQRKHPYSDTVEIDTSKILFIVGGAFPGIEKIIKKRLNYKSSNSVGIKFDNNDNNDASCKDVSYNDVIEQVTTEDFRKYGLIPEFLGRLPIICPLKELTNDELCQILTKPKNALIKQYSTMLKYDNVELKFDQDAVKAIADKAIKNKTGARGLRSIMENILLKTMFTTPDKARQHKSSQLIITKDCIENSTQPKLVVCEK